MKRILLLAIFSIGTALTANAQKISEHALGLRIGGSDGYGAEITYQRALGGNNRLEVDLGWRTEDDFDAFKLTGLYQWVWNLDQGFNWYVGAGGGLGSVDASHSRSNDGAFLFLAGNVGIEYDFDIPLLISLDLRPEISFGGFDVTNDFSPDIALGIKYQF